LKKNIYRIVVVSADWKEPMERLIVAEDIETAKIYARDVYDSDTPEGTAMSGVDIIPTIVLSAEDVGVWEFDKVGKNLLRESATQLEKIDPSTLKSVETDSDHD